jgi:hypothetical protein
MKDNLILSDFYEALIDFVPTYRRVKHDDSFSNKREQSPSYCDRILLRHNENYNCEVLHYFSKDKQYGSDHRPVNMHCVLQFECPYFPIPHLFERHSFEPLCF